jgi:hypothetical protein
MMEMPEKSPHFVCNVKELIIFVTVMKFLLQPVHTLPRLHLFQI